MSAEELAMLSKKVLQDMHVSLQKLTVKQAQSQVLYDMRCGRITAFVAHDVLRTNHKNPAPSIILNICQKSKVTKTKVPALQWGIEHEGKAMDDYKVHTNLSHEKFYIHQ